MVTRHHLRDHEPFGRQRWPSGEGLPLSLFHPYKGVPPEGTTLPLDEERCDPEEELCRTPLHVYEARCTACSGTGWARAPTNGRRGQLSVCMVCHGLAYVRRTTSRFCPDDPDKHLTIARPLTWKGKFAARFPPIDNARLNSTPGGGPLLNGGSRSNSRNEHHGGGSGGGNGSSGGGNGSGGSSHSPPPR